jgi:hypothetical protein
MRIHNVKVQRKEKEIVSTSVWIVPFMCCSVAILQVSLPM